MSQELLYTSAAEGLNPSDQGFCTVACTQGMPRNLKELLENLSGYRQADQPPHPVNYSHLIHTVGGKRQHILSRVSDYEKDYSGRTNKLAHHVTLTVDELPSSGPAALLSNSLCQTRWDGETRWISSEPVLPAATAYQGPCQRWEALTGDAGWAGVLAESAADGSNRPMYVIFPAGENVLPLVNEALGILPKQKAWGTSFSTYFTKLPAGVDCLWRFVLEGSPEANQARAASHGRVIDLPELQKSRRRAPEGNLFVDAARAGRVVEMPTATPGATFAASSPAAMVAASAEAPDETAQKTPASPFATAAPASPFGPRTSTDQNSSKLMLILGGVTVLLFIGVGTLVYSMMSKDIPKSLPSGDRLAKRDKTKENTGKTEKFLSPQEQARIKAQKSKSPEQTTTIAKTTTNNVVKPPPPPMDTGPKIKGPWDRSLADVRKTGGVLSLPERKPSLVIGSSNVEKRKKLAEIHVADASEIDLTLFSPAGSSKEIGAEGSPLEGFILEPPDDEDPDATDKSRRWVVKRKIVNPFMPNDPYKDEVGTFELADQELFFEWNMQAGKRAKALSLPYCLLEISKDGAKQPYLFQLSQPQQAEPLSYDVATQDRELLLKVNTEAIDDPQALRLDLEFQAEGIQNGQKAGMKRGDKAEFRSPDGKIEIELVFSFGDNNKGPHLIANTFIKRDRLVTGGERKKEVEQVGSIRENIDLIKVERDVSLPASLLDLDRLANRGQAIASSLGKAGKLLAAIRQVKQYQAVINREDDPKSRQALINKQKPYVELVGEYEKRAEIAAGYQDWSESMRPRLEKIANTSKVNYSIYTIIKAGGENKKVYLAKGDVSIPDEKSNNKQGKNGGGKK